MAKSECEAGQSQRERFEQAARELGVELDEESLKNVLKQMRYSDTPKSNGARAPKDGKSNY